MGKEKSDRALCLSEMPRKTEGQEYPCPQSEAEELFHRACQVWGVSDLANVSACGGNGERLQGSPLRLGNRAILVETLVAIQRILGRYLDSFSFISPMAIRENKKDVFRHLATFDTYPKYTAIDTLKRNGFDGNLHDVAPARLITALLTDPKAETLMKAGQYDLLRHCLHSSTRLDDYWPSVKICLRNGYTITDGSMWCDTIDLLKRMGKDIRCPKYVCPADLKAEHDKLVEQRNRKEERERLALRRKEAAQYEKGYLSQKGKFFGILITDGTLNVRVLESVAEIAEEGTLMHHCVYANAYYRKENSLILSATIGNKRIETVEVDLKKLCVVQSRGVCNQNTEYHDRIVNLVNSNMNLIRQRIRT